MPKPVYKIPKEAVDRERQVEAALEELDEFLDLAQWYLSKKGNLCRDWDDATVTVFRRNGRYGWSISYNHGGEPEFSKQGFTTIPDAQSAAAYGLGVGRI